MKMTTGVIGLIWKPKLYILLHTYLPCSWGSVRIPLTHGYGCRKRRLIPFSGNFFLLLNVISQTCVIVVWVIFISYKSLEISADHILLQLNEHCFRIFMNNQFANIYLPQNIRFVLYLFL